MLRIAKRECHFSLFCSRSSERGEASASELERAKKKSSSSSERESASESKARGESIVVHLY